jgi:xylose isomerase
MIQDGRIDDFVAKRYASWGAGIGADIIAGKADLASLEKYALEKGEVIGSVTSARQEMLEDIMNNIMFTL